MQLKVFNADKDTIVDKISIPVGAIKRLYAIVFSFTSSTISIPVGAIKSGSYAYWIEDSSYISIPVGAIKSRSC